ncbi:hypothetical protein CFOL_v3_05461, partial [Cephalotus follicularis]
KSQIYYEYILVETDSIKLSPKTDPNNPNLVTHTTIFIQKILTVTDRGQAPLYAKQFSSPFVPSTYNYFDYIDAWKYAFLFQNTENKHFWFFYIDKTFDKNQFIPYWFINWWVSNTG